MSEPFRTTLPPGMFRPRMPLWLARILALFAGAGSPRPNDGTGDTYEVTLSRHGRDIEIITVQARSEYVARDRAERYFRVNILATAVRRDDGTPAPEEER